jgi:hypothetical protein
MAKIVPYLTCTIAVAVRRAIKDYKSNLRTIVFVEGDASRHLQVIGLKAYAGSCLLRLVVGNLVSIGRGRHAYEPAERPV